MAGIEGKLTGQMTDRFTFIIIHERSRRPNQGSGRQLTIRFIAAEKAIAFHDRILHATSGVKGMAGPLMRRVLNQYIYENVSDAFAPAAIHLLAISRGHIFNDGNMRTALFITLLFLRHNRIEIQSSDILTVEATLGS